MNEPHPEMVIRRAHAAVSAFAYRYRSESHLHTLLAEVLDADGLPVEREVTLDAHNRVDLLLPAGVAVEVKVDGTLQEALRQIGRYISFDRITGALLVATPRWAASTLRERPKWGGKPFDMVCIRRQAL